MMTRIMEAPISGNQSGLRLGFYPRCSCYSVSYRVLGVKVRVLVPCISRDRSVFVR